MRGKKRMQVQMTNRDLRNIFQIKTLRNISIVYIFTITSNPSYIFQLLERGTLQIWRSRKFSGKIFIFPFRKFLEKIKIHLLQRIHGGTFGNESLLKKTTAERQLQRLRKKKESTSSTTAQQSRRMDASTQTIVRLTLVASPLELKTPSYKLLLIVKAVKTLFIELLGRQRILLGREEPYIEKKIIVNLLGREEPYIEKKIIVNLLGQKEPEINVKLKIEKNNKFLIINEYKNKFMNKEEENSYSENESNSSEEETDKQIQPKLKQNISKRKIKKINLKAINDKIVTTIGKIIIILLLNNNKIKTEFHVVDKEFPIPRDGILGHHFLLQNNAIIDKQELIQEQRIELNVIKESDL
ncbi:hypothetical protein AGLY_013924 [Aphis glycines]|uniref:Uncharacterized protein n=1 Tax=Aphis glycines TaxID=307491 RepID=A0A6G0T5J5_APHGL|nr:hypothetical protein AGLY_013924 [Aphis glycines]